MHRQPKARNREALNGNVFPQIWRKVENIALYCQCSKAYVITVLLAKALNIDLGDDYELARKIRSYCN